MKSKRKEPTRASRAKAKARRQLGENPSEREVKNFIVRAIETSLSETLEQLSFSKREVKDLLEGSTKALTIPGSPMFYEEKGCLRMNDTAAPATSSQFCRRHHFPAGAATSTIRTSNDYDAEK